MARCEILQRRSVVLQRVSALDQRAGGIRKSSSWAGSRAIIRVLRSGCGTTSCRACRRSCQARARQPNPRHWSQSSLPPSSVAATTEPISDTTGSRRSLPRLQSARPVTRTLMKQECKGRKVVIPVVNLNRCEGKAACAAAWPTRPERTPVKPAACAFVCVRSAQSS
jgi:hypothetical protein